MRIRSVAGALITAVLLAGCSSETYDQTQLRAQAIYTASAAACDGHANLLDQNKNLAKGKQFNKLARIEPKHAEIAVAAYEVIHLHRQMVSMSDNRAPLLVEMWKSYARIDQFCVSLAGE
jgi:hypothetical protein